MGVTVATSIGSEAQTRVAPVALLVVRGPGYHDHGVVYAGEVGPVAVAVAEGRLMWAADVEAATAAEGGIVVEPGVQLAAASAEHMRASRDQDVQTPVVSPVEKDRRVGVALGQGPL